jgi:hypothetical protein
MKLAIYSESSADEAAVHVLANSILGQENVLVNPKRVRSRGWPGVRNMLAAIYLDFYFQTDVEGLVVVVDSDHAKIHHPDHETPNAAPTDCRLCELRRVADRIKHGLAVVPGRGPLRLGIGVATPAIEAWYATGINPHVNEATWMRAMRDKQFPYTKQGLKKLIYGTDRPSIEMETERARAAAIRVAENLPELEARFPNGFGTLAAELRLWV